MDRKTRRMTRQFARRQKLGNLFAYLTHCLWNGHTGVRKWDLLGGAICSYCGTFIEDGVI